MPSKTHTSRESVNGEAKAADDSKAKAAEKAKAAKAEAEKKAAEAEANEKALGLLVPELLQAGAILETAQTSLGNILHRAEAFIPSQSFQTVQAFAEAHIPEHSGPMWTSSPAYRSLQAARVVDSVGADLIGSTSVDALTYLHRFTPDQRVSVFKAAKGRSRKPSVSRASLVEKAREMFPEAAESKKGPKSGSDQAKRGATSKARSAKAEKAAVQEVLDAIGAVRPESDPEPTGPIVKEALASIGQTLQGHVDRFGGDAYQAGFVMFSDAVDLCEKYTVPVVRAALRVRDQADTAKRNKALTDLAEAPKARTRKTIKTS